MATPYRVVLVTTPTGSVGKKIARDLIHHRLAACVNIIPAITSVYRWKKKMMVDGESLLIIKTRAAKMGPLTRRITQIHPYSVPEVVALPIVKGNKSYLQWLNDETAP